MQTQSNQTYKQQTSNTLQTQGKQTTNTHLAKANPQPTTKSNTQIIQ